MSRSASLRLAATAAAVSLFSALVVTTASAPAAAQANASTRGPSGLPLPRFVSLKSGKVNSRIGPGLNYAVEWLYLKPGLPMEIIQEYDNWRRIRDSDGAEGWVNQSLLSGRRTAIVAPWQKGKDARVELMAEPQSGASQVAALEPGVIGAIHVCNGDWCEMSFGDYTGWVQQSQVWGAYPGELVKD